MKRPKLGDAMFDEDENGFIELHEFKSVMGGFNLSDNEWEEIIKEFDEDKDAGKGFVQGVIHTYMAKNDEHGKFIN